MNASYIQLILYNLKFICVIRLTNKIENVKIENVKIENVKIENVKIENVPENQKCKM